MREPRTDALYDIEISTPAGVLVSLKATDYNSAFTACKSIQDSSNDQEFLRLLNSCMDSFGFCGASANGYSVKTSAYLPKVDTGEVQTCGRRMAQAGHWERKEGLDTWKKIGEDRVCSFCGSLDPDRVLELVREHGFGIIDRSDKSYKMYVNRSNVPNACFGGLKYYRFHDTPEFIEAWNLLVEEFKNKSSS